MDDRDVARWDAARLKMLERWRQILERIRAQDEGGVLDLVNSMDEFCDEAVESRQVAASESETRCLFCRTFNELGGCMGLVNDLDTSVLHGRWEKARCLAEGYIGRLEALNFAAATHARRP